MASKTDTEQAALNLEIIMFGCSRELYIQSVEESVTFKYGGPGSVIIQLLSDARKYIAHDDKKMACQAIHKANLLVVHYRLGIVLK